MQPFVNGLEDFPNIALKTCCECRKGRQSINSIQFNSIQFNSIQLNQSIHPSIHPLNSTQIKSNQIKSNQIKSNQLIVVVKSYTNSKKHLCKYPAGPTPDLTYSPFSKSVEVFLCSSGAQRQELRMGKRGAPVMSPTGFPHPGRIHGTNGIFTYMNG